MKQVFRIEGMHCDACVKRVTRALAPLSEQARVTLDPPEAQLEVAAPLTLHAVQSALQKAGDYRAAPVVA
jgi:copper chaperone CopZ